MTRMKMILPLLAMATLLAACGEQKPTPVDELEMKARKAAENAAAQTLEPWEIENIQKRRVLMGTPGLITYVVFLNDMGQPIDYFPVNGKCTSSNKRLSPSERFGRGPTGYRDLVVSAPSEDGTFGPSDEYVYCFTTDGKTKQWNGDYYLSDHPIELTIKPLVVDMKAPNESGIQQQQ